MDTDPHAKRIAIFLAFAFGVPWGAALVIWLLNDDAAQAVGLANIFFISTPWLANLATRLITKEGFANLWLKPNFKRGWRFYLAAWLLPFLATLVGAVVFYLAFPRAFDSELGSVRELAGRTPQAAGINPWLIFLSMTLSILFVSSLINSVASIGEEFGWRGYLLQKLAARFSGASAADPAQVGGYPSAAARKAALLTGLIHGVWHWPLLLMASSITPGFSFLTPLAYLVYTIALSLLLSWATLRSGSVWPASVGHGAANAASALPMFLLKGRPISLVGPDPSGLLGSLGYVVLALVLYFSQRAFPAEKAAVSDRVESSTAGPA